MIRLSMLFVAFLSFMESAFAQLTVRPSAPVAFEEVHVQAPLSLVDLYYPGETQISMEGNRITISVLRYEISPSPFIADLEVIVGRLPVGTYDVALVRRWTARPAETVATTRFVVSPKPPKTRPAPTVDYTDHWWNPIESGWGIVLTQHANDAMFAAWFVYGADGKPTWYVIPSGEWTNSSTYTGAIYKTTGLGLGVPFDPSKVTRTPVGSGTLSFSSFDKATFTYTVDGVTGTKSIERFAF